MRPWTDDQVWEAVDAWRWSPPSSTVVSSPHFQLAVTPGSYALTYAYGLNVEDPSAVESVLDDLRARVEALGGAGVRIQLTPRSRPSDLDQRLTRRGYRPREEAEAMVWELRDEVDRPRLPPFRPTPGISVREVETDADYDGFLKLSGPIFGDPAPSEEAMTAFRSDFHRKLREDGHSDRFVAWDGELPLGRAGLEVAGSVARLWGSGVLPEHRGRGIYGALVQVRCAEAERRGAELALVVARVGTSGPILKHHGFRVVGSVRVFEARWAVGR